MDYKLSQKVIITNKSGLHARPAAKIARIAQEAHHDVSISHGSSKADASSIIDILSLACPLGAKIKLKIHSKKDVSVLKELIQLFETGFGE